MQRPTDSATTQAMDRIEEERRRDRFVRRVSKIAWGATFIVTIAFVALSVSQFVGMRELTRMSGAPFSTMLGLLVPAVAAVGAVCVLIATLSTIGIFLRLRTASLQEIQLRLAALEDMLTRDGGSTPTH